MIFLLARSYFAKNFIDDSLIIGNYISNAKKMMPNLDIKNCLPDLGNSSYEIKCVYKNGITACPTSLAKLEVAWLLQCIAEIMIETGFQIPVYVNM
jgi:hypothetical protein